ncbi:LPD7 domain-containing protein [Pseudomonas corrugata]|uniref:LPD7 domain-containing protein n=1 Tax=Pseudomonas corrugata TaxID=47879 RepID=UPI000AC3AD1A
MLIRLRGYNDGAKEYLEEGAKQGREHTRDELDERVILHGDLDVTQRIYQSIPDNGQERYLSYTLAFKEDHISYDTLLDVSTEFKQFLLHAYKEHEINFYAEAHLPKIKRMRDRKTGEMIDRKPHIHIIIPRKNMFNGNEANPAGMHQRTEKYMEAFQEYINQKYNLASPRDHIRFDPKDSASVLSRYKGDDFYGKNREFKQDLVKQIVSLNIQSRSAFYELVALHGETRVRNEGKDNEYLAVKLPGDAKFTNLKDTIFKDDFVVRRQLKRPPLEKHVIQERLIEWPTRAREIKYVDKATASFRELYYKQSSAEQQSALLVQREQTFYQTYGEHHGGIHPPKRPRSGKRSTVETGPQRSGETPSGVQDVSGRGLADNRQIDGQSPGALLLPGAAQLHLERPADGRDSGLRAPVQNGRGRGGRNRSGRAAAVSSRTTDFAGPTSADGNRRVIPPYGRNLHSVPTVADIEAFSTKLLQPHRGEDSPDPKFELTPRRRRQRKPLNESMSTIPPYARNPHRNATVQDVEAYSTQLLGPLRAEPETAAVRDQAKPQRKIRALRSSIPPYARNPHRPATVADIEAFSARLFDSLREPTEDANQRAGPTGIDTEAGSIQGQAKSQRRLRAGPVRFVIPPYARNPNKVATVADIEAHSRRLFAALQGDKPAQVFRIQTAKQVPASAKRNASTVAASLSRSLEQSQLLPAQRHAIRRVDNQFYELRRFVFADARLTRQDKTQLFSVLTFERLKAQEAIKQTKSNREVSLMGSANIRQLLAEDESFPDFSISGPGSTTPVRDRIKNLVESFGKEVNQSFKDTVEKLLKAAGLYSKKSMFSANVHYVDQKTDKTLFVDTGSSISLRRTEISAPAVALALEMAQQRFGNTLSINGNDEFKKMVVDAAVEKQLPIQYTDSGLNQQIAARLSELESIKHEQDRVSVNFTREFLSGLQPESPVERSVEATKDETQTTPRSLAFTLNGEPASLGLRQVDLPKGMDLEAPQPQGNEAPLPLAFTFNGETASLGLRPAQSESPLVQTNQVGGTMAAPQPLNFVHNGETASLGLRSTQSLPEHVSPVIEEGETDFSDVDSDSYDLHYRDHLEHPDFEEAGLEYPDSGEDLEIPDYDPSDD